MTKPKGGISFITDFDRKDLLALTHGPPQTAQESASGNKAMALGPAPAKKVDEAQLLENSDLPKF